MSLLVTRIHIPQIKVEIRVIFAAKERRTFFIISPAWIASFIASKIIDWFQDHEYAKLVLN
jgi:hypothetical protein